jgi:hypothetical protein
MNKDLLKFGEKASLERTELAVVAELIGTDGKLKLIKSNLSGTRRVMCILVKADGTELAITCSKKVSAGIRDKSISIPNLLGFSVYEGKAFKRDSNGDQMHDPETGAELFEAYPAIEMPADDSAVIEFDAGKVEAYVAPVFDASELVAF